jgi:hypothetical protein
MNESESNVSLVKIEPLITQACMSLYLTKGLPDVRIKAFRQYIKALYTLMHHHIVSARAADEIMRADYFGTRA